MVWRTPWKQQVIRTTGRKILRAARSVFRLPSRTTRQTGCLQRVADLNAATDKHRRCHVKPRTSRSSRRAASASGSGDDAGCRRSNRCGPGRKCAWSLHASRPSQRLIDQALRRADAWASGAGSRMHRVAHGIRDPAHPAASVRAARTYRDQFRRDSERHLARSLPSLDNRLILRWRSGPPLSSGETSHGCLSSFLTPVDHPCCRSRVLLYELSRLGHS
jgi:hypothetical protein